MHGRGIIYRIIYIVDIKLYIIIYRIIHILAIKLYVIVYDMC